ncbi:TPA: hypothetical protein P0E36_005228 [Vibrio harveyi]|nr:hypothetical protein [Vibrio harveyi]
MKRTLIAVTLMSTVFAGNVFANDWAYRGDAHLTMKWSLDGNQNIERIRDVMPILKVDRVSSDLYYQSKSSCMDWVNRTKNLVTKQSGKFTKTFTDHEYTPTSVMNGFTATFPDGSEMFARCISGSRKGVSGYIEAKNPKK